MNYEELIETVSLIVENPKILKDGLTLVYQLNDKNYKQMNEHLFYKSNPPSVKFIPSDILEIELGGVLVRLIKE